MKSKLFVLVLVVVLTALVSTPIAASPFHSTPLRSGTLSASLRDFVSAPCAPGAAYDPACDANQDGAVNVLDVQLTAGHWNQTGTFTSDNNHNHLGQTWTGSNNPLRLAGDFGNVDPAPLILSNSAFSGAALRVDSAAGYGLYVASAFRDGVVVIHTSRSGVEVSSAGYYGVHVYSAGFDGFAVCSTGNASNCTPDDLNANGLEVANAEDYGAKVIYAGRAAFRSDDSGTNGLYVATAGDSGVWVASATNWAGYFGGNINVAGNCTGCRIAQMAVNMGNEALQPGDIVAMDGIAASPFDGVEMLMQVRHATPGSSLLGVVSGRAEPYTSREDSTTTLVPRTGQAAAPGEYLSVVIYGPVQVKATDNVQLGDRVTLADTAEGVRALSTFQVQRTDGGLADMIEAAPVLGIALDNAVDGTVWVLVNLQ